jgi:hypothetical protein
MVSWIMAVCGLVEGHHCFGENYCLQPQDTNISEEPTSTNIRAEDRDIRYLQNVDMYLPSYTVSHPRRI